MLETWQILLVAVVTVLTILLTVVGVQVVYILRQVREILRKTNNILDNAGDLTKTLASSFGSVAGFGAGLKAAVKLISLFKKRKESEDR